MLNRLAAFQNPEFYKAQSMRLPTFDKPRVICCAEEFPSSSPYHEVFSMNCCNYSGSIELTQCCKTSGIPGSQLA
jgi:hypothetical protein